MQLQSIRKQRVAKGGFTLIELVVAVAVLSLLTTLAIPSFRTMIARNRVTSQANQLLQLVTLARSEAIRRNRSVTLCIAGASDGTSCSTTETDWAKGISMFSDINGDGVVDASDAVLEVRVPLTSNTVITGNSTVARRITFSPRGLSSNTGTLTIAAASGGHTLYLRMSSTGRPRIEE